MQSSLVPEMIDLLLGVTLPHGTSSSPCRHKSVTRMGDSVRVIEIEKGTTMELVLKSEGMNALGVTFPADLRAWVGERELLGVVLGVVSALDLADVDAHTVAEGGTTVPLRMILTLNAFSYLTGRYSSEQIEEESKTDETLRYICSGRAPSWNTIRRFRRLNRRALTVAMAMVLGELWLRRNGSTGVSRWLEGNAAERCGQRDSSPWRSAIHEAGRRFDRSVLTDTMNLDV